MPIAALPQQNIAKNADSLAKQLPFAMGNDVSKTCCTNCGDNEKLGQSSSFAYLCIECAVIQCVRHALRDKVTQHTEHMMMRVRLLSQPPEKYWKDTIRVYSILKTAKLRNFLANRRQKARKCNVCERIIQSEMLIWRFYIQFNYFQPSAMNAFTVTALLCAASAHMTMRMPTMRHMRCCAINCDYPSPTTSHNRIRAKSASKDALKLLLRFSIRHLTKTPVNHLQQQDCNSLNQTIAAIVEQEKREKEEKQRRQIDNLKYVAGITDSPAKIMAKATKLAKKAQK